MDDSGIGLSSEDQNLIDIIYASLEDGDMSQLTPTDLPNFDFYELRSKTVPVVADSPSLKTQNADSRTRIKQQLQRDQLLQEREKKRIKEEAEAERRQAIQKSNLESLRVPKNMPSELPQHVLNVTTKLQNPTKYHILAKRNNQVLQYLSTSQQDDSMVDFPFKNVTGAQSAPVVKVQPPDGQSSYNAMRSPELMSPSLNSVATSCGTSEEEDVLEGILEYEASSLASDNTTDETQSLMGIPGSYSLGKNKTHSCPSGLQHFKQELDADPKDRMKKDNHNMIERRRRYNINDRIKELGDLLPKSSDRHYDIVRDSRSNKGTILKSSVDYIKVLRNESHKVKHYEVENKQLQSENRKLLLRIQQLELQAKANGLNVGNSTWKPATPNKIIDQLIMTGPVPEDIFRQVPMAANINMNMVNVEEMEEDGIIRKDPMLYSTISNKSPSSTGSPFCEDVDMNSNS